MQRKKFSEPVALSSTQPADVPLARTRPPAALRPTRAPCSLQEGSYPGAATGSRAFVARMAHFAESSLCDVRVAIRAACSDHKNSPSRWRFRPQLPLTFRLRVRPPGAASTYSRSVLGASGTLRGRPGPIKPGRNRFSRTLRARKSPHFHGFCGRGGENPVDDGRVSARRLDITSIPVRTR
jgi:hypothetical protein